MCVSSCVIVFFIVIVIEPERALKYANFFLREVTVIVIVTKHPFLLPSIGQPHSQLVSLVDWASIRFSNESKRYQRQLCQIQSSSKKKKMSLTLARTLTTAPLTRWAWDMEDSPMSSIIISWLCHHRHHHHYHHSSSLCPVVIMSLLTRFRLHDAWTCQ